MAMVASGERLRAVAVLPQAGQARPRVAWAWEGLWPSDAPGQRAALAALTRAHGHTRRVWVLPPEHYRIVAGEAPADVPPEAWRDVLRWQLKGQVDFDVADASIDLLTLPGDRHLQRRKQLLAVLAPHAALRPVVHAAVAAKAPLTAIDIPETALRNLSHRVAPEGRAQALLSFSAGTGSLVVTAGEDLVMYRQIDVTADSLNTEDDARREAALDRIGLEVQRTLDSFDRLHSHLSLARLLVVPGPGMAALTEHLRTLTYVPVLPFDLAEALDLSATPELSGARAAPWLLALGAALRMD
ncbi:MAG: agglutinin biogenesis protein MshI [Inhella sp.]|jgi:MSHA biogenesis protein MshI|nr:agglutinin biogenesis protein MshI [Inhella sp.]